MFRYASSISILVSPIGKSDDGFFIYFPDFKFWLDVRFVESGRKFYYILLTIVLLIRFIAISIYYT